MDKYAAAVASAIMRLVMVMLCSTAALQMPALQVPWKRTARVRQESAAVSSDTVLKHGLEVAMLKTVLGSSAVDENGCRISRTKQAKQLFKRYGAAYLTTSISLSLISYWLCWSAVGCCRAQIKPFFVMQIGSRTPYG